jgi:hypothetical protein
MTAYDDGKIACSDTDLVISNYYFPAGAKRIPYTAIREVRMTPLRVYGKFRIWGSGDFVHWFNLDGSRPRKQTALVIYLDQRIRPVITPDQPEQVAAELASHGVNVISGQESGAV